ncbi:hypothetical protein L596_005021 [Steinernema carpocapsae]|uniref:Uncharacterized protein n=1 Tax=Steinernema carpocapsae TaxID=34508 RepID=A0A4U8UXN5_STECR|nr:hypothetical protein L596_005021 [Steinernema carpocapsae]
MNQAVCGGFVLSIALLNSVFNPCYRRTRKGILIVHWTVINYISASKHYLDLAYNPGDLALLTASFYVLLEHHSTRYCAGREVSYNERITLIAFLLLNGLLSFTLAPELICTLRVLVVAGTALLAGRMYFAHPRNPHRMNHTELTVISHDDLFYSWKNPFGCFGILGSLTLFLVLLNSTVQIYPSLLRLTPLLYILYVLRSLGTLGLLFCPGFFAGTVQSAKSIGRLIAELKTMNQPETKTLEKEESVEVPSNNQPAVIRLV